MENKDIGEILDSLIDNTTSNNIETYFIVESMSGKLTRRQTIILRLILTGEKSQVKIAKILGFSAPTINLDIRKIKEILIKVLSYDGKDYSRHLIKKIKSKKLKAPSVFNIGGVNGSERVTSTGKTKTDS
jgi:DNA-binding CsgD family transcriptional regulator